MANSIWKRIDHKVWTVIQELGDDDDSEEFNLSATFVKTLLPRLAEDELVAILQDGLSLDWWDVLTDGCSCEEHLTEYREAAAVAGGEGA